MAVKERYASVDASRLLLAFLVICVHYPFSFRGGSVFSFLATMTVPIFLMISGFFMYSEDVNTIKAKIKKTLPKLLVLSILSSVLYLIIELIEFWFYDGADSALNYLIQSGNIKTLFALIVFNDPISGYHLWYIYAYLYVLVLYLAGIGLILKYRKFFIVLSFLLLAVFAGFDTYGQTVFGAVAFQGENIFNYKYLARNAYVYGFSFFTIGFFLGDRKFLKKCENKSIALAIAAAAGFAISMLEHRFIGKFEYMSFGVIVMSVSAFLFLLTKKNILSNTQIPRLGRQYALYIYLAHVAVGKFLTMLIDHTAFFSSFTYLFHLIQPLVVFALSLLFSILYVRMKNRVFKRSVTG